MMVIYSIIKNVLGTEEMQPMIVCNQVSESGKILEYHTIKKVAPYLL